MPDNIIHYDSKKIRILLTCGFTPEEIRRFSFDEPGFKPVYDELASRIGKAEIIDRLIEYAYRKSLVKNLLEWVKENNPKKYEEYKPYELSSTSNSGQGGTMSSTSPVRVGQKPTLVFEIKISRHGPVFYKAEIDSPQGQIVCTFQLPISKPVIEATLADFRKNLQHTRRLVSGEVYPSEIKGLLTPEDIGSALFQAIFQPEVLQLYKASRQVAKQHRPSSLPIILNIDLEAGDLMNLPWEFLYDTSTYGVRGQFLAFDQNTPIIRRWLKAEAIDFSYDPPLRVLLISANPTGSELLNVQREYKLIHDKLTVLNQAGATKVRVDYLPAATLDQLKQIVRDPRRTPHIIHFMGHGCLGSLLFEDKEGGQKNVSEKSLAISLKNAPSLRLVVLNACETAQTDLLTWQLGVAQSLADIGIPAIVAMQFSISDKAALTFAAEFYQLIAEGHAVDSAMTWARIAVQDELKDSLEWATPVFYLQAPDGNILADLLGESLEFQEKKPETQHTAAKSTMTPDQDETTPSKTAQMRREVEEKEEQIEHLQKLRHEHIKRLRAREIQAAQYGLNADPHITIEIANIREEIKELEKKLKALDPEITFTEMVPPPTIPPPAETPGIDDSKMVKKIKEDSGIHSQAYLLYTQGRGLLDKGEWGQALSCFGRAQKLSPGLPDIHHMAEQARRQWLQTQEGQSDYLTIEALYDQAQQHLVQHNLEKATSLLERIVRTDAGYKDVYNLALKTRAQADKEKAEWEKQTALKKLYAEAQASLHKNEWARAVEALNQVVELDEYYQDAQCLLAEATKQRDLLAAYQEGELHFQKKDWTKAVAAFGKVTSIDEGYGDAAKLLSLSRKQKQLDAWLQEAEEYLQQHHWEAAIEVLVENHVAAERDEAGLALDYAYGRLAYKERNWAQAVKHFQEVIEKRPNYQPDLPEFYQEAIEELRLEQQFAKAITYIEQDEWAAAKTTLESLVQNRPDYPMAQERLTQVNREISLVDHYQRARNAIELKQWPRAISVLKEIPDYKDAGELLDDAKKQLEIAAFFKDGLEAVGSGRWTEAVTAFSRVVELDPEHQEAQQQLDIAVNKVTLERDFTRGMQALHEGRQSYNLERLNEAVAYLETVHQIDPRYRGVENRLHEAKRERFLLQHYQDGLAAYQREQWVTAIEHWQVIVQEENEPDYHGDSARRLAEAKHRQRLAGLYLTANQHFKKEEWNNAMMLLEELQEEATGEVYKDTDKLLAEARLQQELLNHYQQAQQLMAAEQWEQAINHLGQIQAKRPAYRQVEIERMVVEAKTNYEATRHYEAGLQALKDEKWSEAATYFDKVFNLKPDFRDICTRLRQARQQETLQQRYQSARQAMTEETWEEAHKHLVAIQSLDPDFKDARQQLEEVERQQQLAILYRDGLTHFAAEHWAEACVIFDKILAQQKDYKETKKWRDEAQQQLDMAARYNQAMELIAKAKQQPENWQLAAELLAQVVAWQPDYQDTPSLLTNAQQQAHLYNLYQRATVLGAKNEITDLEQAIQLLGQLTKVDLNYRDAATLKGQYEATLIKRKEEQRRADVKALYNLALENTKKRDVDQVLEVVLDALGKMIMLDARYQGAYDQINHIIQQCLEKYQHGQQLKTDRKREREAITILKEYERDRSLLPTIIEGILRQNPPE